MRVAYFDCFSGVSGDMTLGALVHAGVDAAAIESAVRSLALPAELRFARVKKKGFAATHATVVAASEHTHRHLHHIVQIIDAAALSDSQKQLATRIFRRLAEAEAAAHGSSIEKVHFHEVGAVDSIVDIVGAAVAIDLLAADRIICSPIPTGCGTVRGAHGLMPIPAPGTAELLRGVPLAPSTITSELTTPTGAAIVTTVAAEFGPIPAMRIDAIGYGAGTRDLAEQPNVLRVLVGSCDGPADPGEVDQVCLIETNLDDVSSEFIGFAIERLFAAGALDVFTTAIGMKKNRPGVIVSVICDENQIGSLEEILFRETGTFGVRLTRLTRHKMCRELHQVDTAFGPVAGKLGRWRNRSVFTPEYEDCRRVALERDLPLRIVYAAVERAVDK